jgi:hypothetical protein
MRTKHIKGKCWIVSCVVCDIEPKDWLEENPKGCSNCGMLEWLCFNTIEEANNAWLKQWRKNGENI